MRILVLSCGIYQPRFCGTRRVVSNSVRALRSLGHSVLGLRAVRLSVTAGIDYEEMEEIEVGGYRMRLQQHLDGAFGACKLTRRTWAGLCKPLRRTTVAAALEDGLQLRVDSFTPEVILAEDIYISGAASRLAQARGIPLCYRVHHLDSIQHAAQPLVERVIRRWESKLLSRIDALVAFTSVDMELLRARSTSPAYCAPLGVNEFTDEGMELPASVRPPFSLYVSSYIGEEEPWLRALAQVCPTCQVVVVGEGCSDFNSPPPNVLCLGATPDSILTRLYRECAFAFFPLILTPGQGFPTKLAEAFTNGVPILMQRESAGLLPPRSEGVEFFEDLAELATISQRYYLRPERMSSRRDPLFDLMDSGRALEGILESLLAHHRRQGVQL